MNEKLVTIVLSLLVLVGTAFGFYWLWSQSNNYTKSIAVPENLQQIEIETVKNDAQAILEDKESVSDIPISVPDQKMGRENPFDGI